MTCSYDELYLPLAMRISGDMFDYAVNTLSVKIEEYFRMFILSGMAHQFEIGNPTYIAGKNGCEVAREVINSCTDLDIDEEDIMYMDKSPEYWIGWALAYYQWHSNLPYEHIGKCVPINEMYCMYRTLHEADLSLFVEIMDEKCRSDRKASMLRKLRTYAGLSQRELSEMSGVALRQIQLFEQGERDISKAQIGTVLSLAKELHCDVEKLLS